MARLTWESCGDKTLNYRITTSGEKKTKENAHIPQEASL